MKFTTVKVAGMSQPVRIPVSSDKPEVPKSLLDKWQEVADLLADTVRVPACLVMELKNSSIEVLVSSRSEGNPYHPGEGEHLNSGLYCETVVGRRKMLLVEDARQDPHWSANPDIKLNMVSYLGMPVQWPDGELLGTLCILDNKRNAYSDHTIRMMYFFSDVLQKDLALLLMRRELESFNARKEIIIREVHHRIKNNFNLVLNFVQCQKILKTQTMDEFIDGLIGRLQAMNVLHSNLCYNVNVDRTELNAYLRELADSLLVVGKARKPVQLQIRGDSIALNMDTLIPCGMIIAELLTNSLKYALNEIADPRVVIGLSKISEIEFIMRYEDNGPGFPADFQIEKSRSLGMALLRTLTAELDGNLIPPESGQKDFTFRLKCKFCNSGVF